MLSHSLLTLALVLQSALYVLADNPVEKWKEAEWKEHVDKLSPLMTEARPSPPKYSLLGPSPVELIQQELEHQYIGSGWLEKLVQLKGLRILMLFDDSGSMNYPLSAEKQEAYRRAGMKRLDGQPILSRYDELWVTIISILPMAIALDLDIECEWLNHKMENKIKINGRSNLAQETARMNRMFSEVARPTAQTPLYGRIKALEAELANYNKAHFLMVFTDGSPSDTPSGTYKELVQAYTQRQGAKKKERTPLQSLRKLALIICTDDAEEVAYMNGLDKKLYDTDVVDDWFEEIVQIMEVYFRLKLDFSVAERYPWGNHLAKMLLGANDREIDLMDECTKNFKKIWSKKFHKPTLKELIPQLPKATLYNKIQLTAYDTEPRPKLPDPAYIHDSRAYLPQVRAY